MSQELVVASVQMTSVDDFELNLKQIEKRLEEIFAVAKPRLVSFPENCLYLRLTEGEAIPGLEITDARFLHLGTLAKKYNSYLHFGSVPLIEEGHMYNASLYASPDGVIHSGYKKMHLFDIQLQGQKAIRESDAFRHGPRPSIFEVDGWKIGESICYDVRFAELYSQYARKEVDLILVPAAFLVKTGEAHWEILLRARAIENQCYLIASAQGGKHVGARGGVRDTYGHSLIIDPWGVKLEELSQTEAGFAVSKLSRERIEQVRAQIPMKYHRRLPVA